MQALLDITRLPLHPVPTPHLHPVPTPHLHMPCLHMPCLHMPCLHALSRRTQAHPHRPASAAKTNLALALTHRIMTRKVHANEEKRLGLAPLSESEIDVKEDEVPLLLLGGAQPPILRIAPDLTRDEASEFQVMVNGKPFGMTLDGKLCVVKAVGPAKLAGVIPGDVLLKVANIATTSDNWKLMFGTTIPPFPLTFRRARFSMSELSSAVKDMMQLDFVRGRWFSLKNYSNSFYGEDLVQWLLKSQAYGSRAEAEGVCIWLAQSGLIRRVREPHDEFVCGRELHVLQLPDNIPQDVDFDHKSLFRSTKPPTQPRRGPGEPAHRIGSRLLRDMIQKNIERSRQSGAKRRQMGLSALPPEMIQEMTSKWLEATAEQNDLGSIGLKSFMKHGLLSMFGSLGEVAPRRLYYCLCDGETRSVTFENWLNAVHVWQNADVRGRLGILFDVFDRTSTGLWSSAEARDFVTAATRRSLNNVLLALHALQWDDDRRSTGVDDGVSDGVSDVGGAEMDAKGEGAIDAKVRDVVAAAAANVRRLVDLELDAFESFFPVLFSGRDGTADGPVSMQHFLALAEETGDRSVDDFLARFALPVDSLYVFEQRV